MQLAALGGASMMATILPFPGTDPVHDTLSETLPAGMAEPHDFAADGERWGQLMLLAQNGDRVAYHALLKAITPYLRAITRRYLGRGEDAEDALQDVLMIVHNIRHTYECDRPFKPWIGTIASRRCFDLLRRRARRLRHEIESGDEIEAHPDGAHGPEESIARTHAADALRQAVAALPQRQRDAVRLLKLNELSLNEAAAQSDQSIGSLKTACHRALKSLQRTLGNKDQTK